MAEVVLYESRYHKLWDMGSYRRLERSADAFDTVVAVEDEFQSMLLTLRAETTPKPLLIDLRAARGRNDAAFEEAMGFWRPRMLTDHPRVVALLGTITGKMHVERVAAEEHTPLMTTLDEAVAIRWVTEQ